MAHRRTASVLLAVAVLLGTAACGSDASTGTAPATDGGATTSPATPAADGAGAAAPSTSPAGSAPRTLRFTARTVVDQPFDARSLAGKDAVFWFWAPWCTECRREAPHVAAVQKATASDVTFVGVAGLGETAAMQSFVRDYEVGAFTHLADLDGEVWKRFGVVQQPAYAFVDDSGKVTVVRGEIGRERLAAEVAALTAG